MVVNESRDASLEGTVQTDARETRNSPATRRSDTAKMAREAPTSSKDESGKEKRKSGKYKSMLKRKESRDAREISSRSSEAWDTRSAATNSSALSAEVYVGLFERSLKHGSRAEKEKWESILSKAIEESEARDVKYPDVAGSGVEEGDKEEIPREGEEQAEQGEERDGKDEVQKTFWQSTIQNLDSFGSKLLYAIDGESNYGSWESGITTKASDITSVASSIVKNGFSCGSGEEALLNSGVLQTPTRGGGIALRGRYRSIQEEDELEVTFDGGLQTKTVCEI